MPTEKGGIRRLIGGRWAVSLRAYLLLAPIAILWMVLSVPEAFLGSSSEVAVGVVVGVVTYLGAGAVQWLASVTVLRNRATSPVPVLLVFLVGGISWAARSALLVVYLDLSGAPSEAQPVVRVASGFVLGAVMVTTTAWGFALLDDFQRSRERLLKDLVAEEVRGEQAHLYLDVMRKAVQEEARVGVQESLAGLPAGQTHAATSASLDELARRMSRDLPRNLWQDARKDRSLSPRLVLAMVLKRPFAVWPLVVGWVLGVLVIGRFWGWTTAMLILLVPVMWGVAVSWLGNRVTGSFPRWGAITYLLSLSLLGLGGVITTAVSRAALPARIDSPDFGLLVGVSLVVFVALGGLLRAVNVAEAQVMTDLQNSISQAEIRAATLEREETRLRQDIAAHLHSTVGANLTAASMRLKQAIKDEDADSATRALSEVQRLVEIDFAVIDRERSRDVATLLNDVIESWVGLVTITLHVDVADTLNVGVMRAVHDVVNEGVSNAVRHGDARNIHIEVREVPARLVISIDDDGVFREVVTSGLGSRIFDDSAPGAWSRTPNQRGGSTLRVALTTLRNPQAT